MGMLEELGLVGGEAGLMLIDPPDSVLVEAGRMKPRPSIASALQVAEPAARMAWWTERRLLTDGLLSRLHWMLSVASGEAWIVVVPEDEGVTMLEVRAAVDGSQLVLLGEMTLAAGDLAVRVGPGDGGGA